MVALTGSSETVLSTDVAPATRVCRPTEKLENFWRLVAFHKREAKPLSKGAEGFRANVKVKRQHGACKQPIERRRDESVDSKPLEHVVDDCAPVLLHPRKVENPKNPCQHASVSSHRQDRNASAFAKLNAESSPLGIQSRTVSAATPFLSAYFSEIVARWKLKSLPHAVAHAFAEHILSLAMEGT